MRFIRSVHVVCFVAGTLLSACAEKPLQQMSHNDETWLEKTGTLDRQCELGINMRQDGVILYLSSRALNAGLRRGDRIIGVDSKPFQDKIALNNELGRRKPGDLLHLSIERQGESRSFDVECHDNSHVKAAYQRAVAAMKANDKAGCLHALTELVGESPQTSQRLGIEFKCEFANNPSKYPTADELVAAYNMFRVLLEEATADPEALETVKSGVIGAIQMLRQGGGPEFADELNQKLKLAEQETYTTPTIAANGDGNKSAPSKPPKSDPQNRIFFGTGFAVAPDGTVITCAHVVKDGNTITVLMSDGKQHKANIVALNRQYDLAILRIDAATPNYLGLESSSEAALGDKLFTIGFPAPDLLGINPKYTEGALAALSGQNDDPRFLQMSVPIQPGNSGGPVVNSRGRVIGVVDSAMRSSLFLENGEDAVPQGINWAVKSDYVKALLKDNDIIPTTPLPGSNVKDAVRKAVVLIVVENA